MFLLCYHSFHKYLLIPIEIVIDAWHMSVNKTKTLAQVKLAFYEGLVTINNGHDEPKGTRVHWNNGVKITSRETWVLSP